MEENVKFWTAQDIEDHLRNRFCQPTWAFIPQVRNATGYLRQVRTADAIAMGLYPSRGLYLHGIEIKIFKNDWKKELLNPEKSEELSQFCDFWWLAAPKDIIDPGDMPTNWGLMVPHGNSMRVIKDAKILTPESIDKPFLAAILRRAQEVVTPEGKIKLAAALGEKKGNDAAHKAFQYERNKHLELQQAVTQFEKLSGVAINMWNGENIGEAVRMVMDGEHLRARQRLKELWERSLSISEDIAKYLQTEVKK